MTGRLATLLFLALSACSRVEKQQLLPWFMIKNTHYERIGSLRSGSTTTEYFVKSRGFWRKLDVYGGSATVLNPDTVAFFASGQMHVIHRGEVTSRPACPSGSLFATLTPDTRAIDCVDVLAGPASAVATKLRFRRVGTSMDKVVSVEGPGRVFLVPAVEFYDDLERPYFVTINAWPYEHPQCAIVTVDDAFIQGPPEMSARDCSEAPVWSKVARRALRLH